MYLTCTRLVAVRKDKMETVRYFLVVLTLGTNIVSIVCHGYGHETASDAEPEVEPCKLSVINIVFAIRLHQKVTIVWSKP